jgi:hypothetical protein
MVHSYKDVEWLKEQVKLGKTQLQLSKECGCSQTTINKYLNFYITVENKKKYYDKNKEYIIKNKKIYYDLNKEKILNKKKEDYLKNRDVIRINQKKYNNKHKEERKRRDTNYYKENKGQISKKNKKRTLQLKIKTFNLLGGCKCLLCGDINLDHLTVDHIDERGSLDRKINLKDHRLYRSIINFKYPIEKLKNLRILCWNCNCSRQKKYLKSVEGEQTKDQRYHTKLWKEAFSFFGSCKTCGDSDLTHLTISHIHNDGVERRRNGEKTGINLLKKFRGLGWPESLKQDYCLECFSCNCSRKT